MHQMSNSIFYNSLSISIASFLSFPELPYTPTKTTHISPKSVKYVHLKWNLIFINTYHPMDFLGSVVSDCLQPLCTTLSTKMAAFSTCGLLIGPSIAKIFNRFKINKLLAFYRIIAGFFGLAGFLWVSYLS